MSSHELTLDVVSPVSLLLAQAEAENDPSKLAAIIAACQLIESRAQDTLLGRVSQNEINNVKALAKTALGW